MGSDQLSHLRNGSTVRVAGLVTTRQRPGTAKGYVFVLMEDTHGYINVIINPDVYQRDRAAVRMEPFLTVRGRLQIDGTTINVIADELQALRVPGTSVRRRSLSWTLATAETEGVAPAARAPDAPSQRLDSPDLEHLPTSVPAPLEYWPDNDEASTSPYQYLTALRQSSPGTKNFG